ncbi:21304_t:CDS:1, partial [Racocetra persica]
PSVSDIHNKLLKWHRILRDGAQDEDEDELVILEAFKSADTIIPTLSVEFPIFPKGKLTSKLLNFKDPYEPIKSLF